MIGVILVATIFIVVGLFAILKGQKLFSLFLSLFAFGFTFEAIVKSYGQNMTTLAIALAVAVVAAILAQYAQKLAFFLMGTVAGAFLGALLVPFVPNLDPKLSLVFIVVVGIVIGILTAHWHKIFIRLGTSFVGGRVLSIGVLFIVFNITHLTDFASNDIFIAIQNTSNYLIGSFVNNHATYILIGSIICTVIGYFAQAKKH